MEPVSSRRSVRLNGYDYTTADSYFITVCTQHKEHRFGHIADDIMWLNEAGRMVAERIQAIPARFPGTLIDSYVVMPNHIHFILTLLEYVPNGGHVGAAHRGRPLSDTSVAADKPPETKNVPGVEAPGASTPGTFGISDDSDWLGLSGPMGPKAGGHDGPPLQINESEDVNDPVAHNVPSVSDVVGWFKASTTNYYIRGVKKGRFPGFDRRLWQRNYYEHIIRTGVAHNQIDEYIQTNPQRWADDRLR